MRRNRRSRESDLAVVRRVRQDRRRIETALRDYDRYDRSPVNSMVLEAVPSPSSDRVAVTLSELEKKLELESRVLIKSLRLNIILGLVEALEGSGEPMYVRTGASSYADNFEMLHYSLPQEGDVSRQLRITKSGNYGKV